MILNSILAQTTTSQLPTWLNPYLPYLPFFTILISFCSFWLGKTQLNNTQKKAAIDLMLTWGKERHDSWAYAVEFAASLDAVDCELNSNDKDNSNNNSNWISYKESYSQTKAFWRGGRIENISTYQEELMQKCRKYLDTPKQNESKPQEQQEGKTFLDKEEVLKIRWLVMSYFNLLEAILLAWKYKIANEQILFDQFKPLIEKNPRFPLNFFEDNLNIESGPKISFPATSDFIKTVKNKNESDDHDVFSEKRPKNELFRINFTIRINFSGNNVFDRAIRINFNGNNVFDKFERKAKKIKLFLVFVYNYLVNFLTKLIKIITKIFRYG